MRVYRRRKSAAVMIALMAAGSLVGAAMWLLLGNEINAALGLLFAVLAAWTSSVLFRVPVLTLDDDRVTIYSKPLQRPRAIEWSELERLEIQGARVFALTGDGSRVEIAASWAAPSEREEMLEEMQRRLK